jgi:hypothetical protein
MMSDILYETLFCRPSADPMGTPPTLPGRLDHCGCDVALSGFGEMRFDRKEGMA